MCRRPLPFARPALGIASLLILSVASTSALATICRVKTDGAGGVDGSDWDSNALVLNAALAKPECIGPGNEIWVKQGVYRAANDILFRDLSFMIPAGAQVYGGFAGTETLRTERDPQVHRSILSGDISDDDIDGDGDGIIAGWEDIRGTNAHHVVRLDGSTTPVGPDTVLDGLVVTAGEAEDQSNAFVQAPAGAGILCLASGATARCSPTLAQLLVIGNDAVPVTNVMNADSGGGGLACVIDGGAECSPVIEQVQFIGNRAEVGGGAALTSYGGVVSPTISGSRFEANLAELAGGGLVLGASSPGTSSPTISDTVFVLNESVSASPNALPFGQLGGGAVLVLAGNSAVVNPTMTDVAFIENTVGTYGSGGGYLSFFVEGSSNLVLSRVSFVDNDAGLRGGALALQSFAPNLDGACIAPAGYSHVAALGNVTFSGNTADVGGALALNTGADCNNAITLANVTFAGNAATTSAGAAWFESGGTSAVPALANAILWGNTAGDGEELVLAGPAPAAPVAIGTSIIAGGCPTGTNCTDVSSADPGLSPLASFDDTTRAHVPAFGGPAIDAGDAAACTGAPVGGVDQRGVPRPQGVDCDIGAVELLAGDATLDLLVTGPGSVNAAEPPVPSSGGIAGCTATTGSCSATYLAESAAQGPVQLQATPDPGFHVLWGGDCDPGGSVLVNEDRSCTAEFVPNTWGVGGSISGLTTTGLALSLSADGGNIFEAVSPGAGSTIFAFAAEVPFGADYAVSFLAVPATLDCGINNASGSMPDADVTDIQVICSLPPEIFADGFE
ncbi:MAG: choice-of-anchor Q domain-containing protein [Lysobacteraceae bacterium]